MSLTKAMQLSLQGRTLNGKTLQLSFHGILNKILDEILTIRVDDWKGIIISCPRNKWEDLKDLDEANYSGIYFLWAKKKNLVSVYIGKADPKQLKQRLSEHDIEKDWWSHCIFVTTINRPTLDPTALYYLESTFIKAADNKEGIYLDNRNKGTTSGVTPDERKEELNIFIKEILEVLEVTGINIFKDRRKVGIREIENPHRNWSKEISKEKFYLTRNECDATIVWQEAEEFVLKKGSKLAPSYQDGLECRDELEYKTRKYGKEGFIGHRSVVRDISFETLNKVASFCCRASVNAWTALKNKEGKSIDEVCKEIYETANTTKPPNVV